MSTNNPSADDSVIALMPLNQLPRSPSVVGDVHKESSNDDGKPRTVWVTSPPTLLPPIFDPRNNAWTFSRR